MAMQLAVVTPGAEALAIECDEVVAPGVNGEIGLLPGHIALVTALRPGVLTVIADKKPRYFAVSYGFAEIESDHVTILTSTCEAAEAIDIDRAKKAFLAAEAKLGGEGEEQPKDTTVLKNRLARARARIDAVARVS